ncbi:MAG: hypothetical protein B6D56_06160 [Candidatus Omnitrophica bacterium 4484_70.1]|nr:MAG: hypothetical protein B6D56_06160 [Candidatus Omnitrophica bacterium 4484_70.1]
MTKKYYILIFVFLMMISMNGCKKIKKIIPQRAKKTTVVPKVESVELAEIIMRPKPYSFEAKDPFKPLIGGIPQIAGIDVKLDLNLRGVVDLGKERLALIESPSKVDVFREKDRIAGYTIENIYPDEVVLKKDKNVVVLKIRR